MNEEKEIKEVNRRVIRTVASIKINDIPKGCIYKILSLNSKDARGVEMIQKEPVINQVFLHVFNGGNCYLSNIETGILVSSVNRSVSVHIEIYREKA